LVALVMGIGAALAADVELGGGVDLVAGVVHPPAGAWTSTGGVRELEGDLLVRTDAVEVEAALDLSATVAVPLPVVFAIVPEQLTVTGDAGPVWIMGGITPAPWRIERVDGWDNALVSWSAEHRNYLTGSLLGAEVGAGTPERGVAGVAGLDMGRGLDFLGNVGGTLTTAPLVVGVYASDREDTLFIEGGVFASPDVPSITGQVGASCDIDAVRLAAQLVGGWHAPFGGHVEVDLFPDQVVVPVARVEYFARQVGGTVGVGIRPRPFLAFKAELGYADGAPQAWVEAAVFRPWPPVSKPHGKARAKKG
jgi:hypothetical protein